MMKKYYIGLAVLMTLTLGALIYTISQAGNAKIDAATDKAVENISSKLDTSIATKGVVPDSLQAAGIKDVPPAVTYKKLNESEYKICISYKTATSGFDASWLSLLGGVYGANQSGDTATTKDYFDSTVTYNHKKGLNCQTIKPYIFSNNSLDLNSRGLNSSGASACGYNLSTYAESGYLKVSAINISSKQLTFSASGQYVSDSSGNQIKTVITNLGYDDQTLFCDLNGNKTTAASLKADESVNIYLQTVGDKNAARIDLFY